MSAVCIKTVSFEGIDVIEIETQVHIANGQPSLTIVGLGDKAVKESKDRIRAAINSIGLSLPAKRITINLAPSDLIKEGAHFDLPIALGILSAIGIIQPEKLDKTVVMGELSLDGRILPVNGVLPAAMYANAMNYSFISPFDNADEAMMANENISLIVPQTLTQLINHIKGIQFVRKPDFNKEKIFNSNIKYGDFYDVRGQFAAKRAAEVAATGGHNLLMYGPPGTGKSMIASRMIGLLPHMSSREILESGIIRSISGEIRDGLFLTQRPYRDPHHSSSMPAMIGGGKNANPGEISLAHNGILFLDELAEFPRQILDSLRQPIETGYVNISRANKHVQYPAKFQLIAAMNPCKCGYFGNTEKQCTKIPACANDYQAKISGPIMDRIDIHVEVSNFIPKLEDDGSDRGEKTEIIRNRVLKNREKQRERYIEIGIDKNSDLSGDMIEKFCILSDSAKKIMQNAINKLDLSMRSYNKILKVSRTIADMNNHDLIEEKDILESLAYRAKLVK